MIPVPGGVRVWLATGHTDMRKGFDGLALLVRETLQRERAACGSMCATTSRFAGRAPPAALFFYSRDRTAEHPERHLHDYAGILQADAYAGFNRLYEAGQARIDHRGQLLGAWLP
jgi:hypothetical protein